jgi:hypothetical protein
MENPGSWFGIRAHRTRIVGGDVWGGPGGVGGFMMLDFPVKKMNMNMR